MKSKYAKTGTLAAVALSLPLLVGCVTTGTSAGIAPGEMPRSDGFLTAAVGPGGGASCAGTPCTIYYKTPALGGDVTVVVNGFTVGTFPSETVVNLGGYTDTTVRITVPGSNVKPAYVNIPNDSR